MSVVQSIPPDPVGQQAPPARAAASDTWRSLRGARVPPMTTGTGCRRSITLDENHEH